jgi:homoserine dehydrogenase
MIEVAIMGCGTVGSGVCRVLRDNAQDIAKRLGDEVRVKKVLEILPERPQALGFTQQQITSSIEEITQDPGIRIVVETMGGTGIAFDFIIQCMRHGKHIVTSNKDLVERHWDALMQCAAENKVQFCFEAAVGGGIPAIQSLENGLAANRFKNIIGILNGTTNYILTRMTRDNLDYSQALRLAQQNGFAEQDPASDVTGTDAARKLAILARLAYNTNLKLDEIYRQGITELSAVDVTVASEMGYAIKLIACATAQEDGITAYVRPAFVPVTHPISTVSDEFNAIFLQGDAVDDVMLYGKGAGSMPTASAVAGDIIRVGRNLLCGAYIPAMETCYAQKPVVPVEGMTHRFYIRLSVDDQPLVLAGIVTALANAEVGLASIAQAPADDGSASLILMTHPTREGNMRQAMEKIMGQSGIMGATTLICMD